jgi:GNAT superfamily N-acetyltransferase
VTPGAALRVEALTGDRAAAQVEALARLRITVFREFPYLYEGTMEYERDYLGHYAKTEGSVIVGAFDGDRLVGASTGLPLAAEPDYVRGPFAARGHDVERMFYFGESVLLPEYRGHGVGDRFFDEREAHARRLGGFRQACFCAVIRPPDHPRRPPGYTTLDRFWTRRGFHPVPGFTLEFTWQDLDEEEATPKPMAVWMRDLE